MNKIGIMGGTFDPVHLAHLTMARCAMQQKGLSEVWFMPSRIPPHKQNRKVSSEEIRGKLVQLAIEGEEGFFYSDFELRRKEVTYTARTLELLHRQYPEKEFFFIMGGDSLFHFEHWYMPEKILQYAVILAVSRNGVPGQEMLRKAEELSERFHGRVELIQMPQMRISSSMIREKLMHGEPAKRYLPSKVYEYIRSHRLYQG